MLNRILAIIAAVIATIILTVTVTTFAVRGCTSSSSEKKSASVKKSPTQLELGQIRIRLKSDEGTSVVVIEPVLSFKSDNSLYEELLQKQLKFREQISMFLSQFTRDELKSCSEQFIKEQLAEIINVFLVMGKVDSIFFKKFIYID